jgi:hypothetical protein
LAYNLNMALTSAASVGLLLMLSASAPSGAGSPERDFSADIVKRDAAGAMLGLPAKLSVSGFKTRIDTPDAAGGFFLTDSAAGTAFFIRSAQRLYVDAKQSTPLTRIFVRVEPRDPCPQWQAAAEIADSSSRDKWQCEPTKEAAVIDPVLHFPVKWRSPNGETVVLENIRIEAQPPDLFGIPAGYHKLDPQALIERIKHSDVWAPGNDAH